MKCHLCSKDVVYIVSHLQKTHNWIKEDAKDFQNRTILRESTLRDDQQRENNDNTHKMEAWSMEANPSSPSLHDDFEPRRKFSWNELDEEDKLRRSIRILDQIRPNFQGSQDHIANMYAIIHQELASTLCQTRLECSDIVDGNIDVNHRLHNVLKPSIDYLREVMTLEMYKVANTLAEQL